MLWALGRLRPLTLAQRAKLVTAFIASAKSGGVPMWRIRVVQQGRPSMVVYNAAHYLNSNENDRSESFRQCRIIRKLVRPFYKRKK